MQTRVFETATDHVLLFISAAALQDPDQIEESAIGSFLLLSRWAAEKNGGARVWAVPESVFVADALGQVSHSTDSAPKIAGDHRGCVSSVAEPTIHRV